MFLEKKRILILGGTGAMGTHLVQILNGQNACVFVTTRSKRDDFENVRYVIGDAHDLKFLTSLFEEHWDAIVDFMSYKTEEFRQREELLLSSTRQYVFISSARVYADTQLPITEESCRLLDVCEEKEYLSTDDYALRKARQEDILYASGKRNWTIVRPYITFSEYRLQLSALEKEHWLYRAIRGRTIVFSKDLANKVTTITYGYDVARCIASFLGKKDAFGETIQVTNAFSCKWSEILGFYLDAIERVTHHRPRVKMIDNWMPFLGGNESQVKRDRLYDRSFNNIKLQKYIDVSTFKPIRQAIEDCIETFVRKPLFKDIKWQNEARKDKLTREWANPMEIKGLKAKLIYFIYRFGLRS